MKYYAVCHAHPGTTLLSENGTDFEDHWALSDERNRFRCAMTWEQAQALAAGFPKREVISQEDLDILLMVREL